MSESSDRLDRIERILDQVALRHAEMAKSGEAVDRHLAEMAKSMSTNGEVVDRHLAEMAKSMSTNGEVVDRRLAEMAARQQYHDEALERMDADIKESREERKESRADMKTIRQAIIALIRVADSHNHRLNGLEGEAPA